MSTVYALVPTVLPATITLPQDLVDQRSAASVNDPITAVANGVAYLNQSLTVRRRKSCQIPIGQLRGGAVAKTYDMKASRFDPLDNTLWTVYGARIRCGVPEATAIGVHLVYPADDLVIDGAVLTRLTAYCIGGSGHAGLPAMMPAIGLARYDPATDTWASLLAAGMQDDTSADVTAYELSHDIRLTPDQNATVSVASYSYYIIVCPEGSTNGQEGLSFYSFEMRQTAPRYQT